MTKSAAREHAVERVACSTPELAEALGGDEGVVGDDAHLSPSARRATCWPIRPKPSTPSVFSAELDPAPLRALPAALDSSAACACGMLRASATSRPIVCSAAETMFDSGAFATTIPRRVAASTSTLSTPTPARPITFRFVGRLDQVGGQLRRRADHDRVVAADDLLEGVSASTSTSNFAAQQLDARLGDLLADEDPHRRRPPPYASSARGNSGAALDRRTHLDECELDRAERGRDVEDVDVADVPDAEQAVDDAAVPPGIVIRTVAQREPELDCVGAGGRRGCPWAPRRCRRPVSRARSPIAFARRGLRVRARHDGKTLSRPSARIGSSAAFSATTVEVAGVNGVLSFSCACACRAQSE